MQLDHIGYVAPALDPLILAMRRLGFAPTNPETLMGTDPQTKQPRSLQQRSCHVVLESGYLELTAVGTDDPAHHLAAWRTRGMGVHILALGTDELPAAHARCRLSGVEPTAVAHATRAIRYGARHGEAEFDWFMLPAARFSPALLCLVHNRRPELVYQPEVTRHPNGAVALIEVSLIVDKPPVFAAGPLAWLGPADISDEQHCRWSLQGGGLTLLSASAAEARWSQRFDEARWLHGGVVALTIRVRDLAVAASVLDGQAVPYERHRDGLLIRGADAGGALLQLQA
jgi:Glyoxalase-like domain